MLVFIVSLKSDEERRVKISKFLNDHNVNYKFIDAVYGRGLSEEYISELNTHYAEVRLGRKIGRGEIGCTLSHLSIYNYIIAQSIGTACILEDDAILDERFIKFINELQVGDMPKNNDLYILGGQEGLIQNKYISRSFLSKKNIAGQVFHKTIRSHKHIFRTCCYIINSSIARELINLSDREFFIADEWKYFNKLNIVGDIYISDFVSHPDDFSSSHLERERVELQEPLNEINPFFVKLKWGIFHRFKIAFSFFKSFFP